MNDIPLIDLSRSEREIVAGLEAACREIGFFTVCGHGINPMVVEDVYAALRSFFQRPLAEKMACRLATGFTLAPDDYTPYGYSALLEENALAYMGQAGQPSDYVEKFSVGRRILEDDEVLPFPDDRSGLQLRAALKAYYAACERLSERLGESLALSLDLPRNYFSVRMDRSDDSLRAHFYPTLSQEFENDQGMGQHTDGTLITLLTHTSPGIAVQTRNGEWIVPGCRALDDFIVNIGDLLAHWTKNRYVSTPHKVVLSGMERQSIVFFKLTNDDEMVQIGNRQMDDLFGR